MENSSVLIVEDEGLIALHLAEILENAGYRIIGPVPSGEEALRMLEKHPKADLVLMDIKLGGDMDGIEAAKIIRKRMPVPLIFITAYSADQTPQGIAEISPEGFLTKPVMGDDLLNLVEKTVAGPGSTGRIP
jgi:CheY-like chemotaxis protein